MRLPHSYLSSPLFQLESEGLLIAALADNVTKEGRQQISYLLSKGLPPVISKDALAVMIGVNSGILWSFEKRSRRHYRVFEIPKGKGSRTIEAPKVGLKIIQTWISYHISRSYSAPAHVCGFVPGRSHVDAALRHVGAEWAYSVDIKDFFPSTPAAIVRDAYHSLGYDLSSASLLTGLSCFMGRLPQGAPTSPPLSNICFAELDAKLIEVAATFGATLTRYADDIVFSGTGTFPEQIRLAVHSVFEEGCWRLAPQKESVEPIKGRIKVHGLLVSGGSLQLTKGYRNKVRAYRHILETRGANVEGAARLKGHVQYADLIRRRSAEDQTAT